MSIISEVKCARCDRAYSGVRSRCPYCGARRIGGGKYSEEGDNSKGKMIIGILILAVLVVAAAVLLFTTPRTEETISEPSGEETSTPPTQELPGESENLSILGARPPVPSSPSPVESSPEETTTPPPKVTSVEITYAGTRIADFKEPQGATIPLRARVEPAGVEFDEEIVWKSSDTSIFDVVKENTEGTAAKVTIISSVSEASAILTVSIGGVQAECVVRVR